VLGLLWEWCVWSLLKVYPDLSWPGHTFSSYNLKLSSFNLYVLKNPNKDGPFFRFNVDMYSVPFHPAMPQDVVCPASQLDHRVPRQSCDVVFSLFFPYFILILIHPFYCY